MFYETNTFPRDFHKITLYSILLFSNLKYISRILIVTHQTYTHTHTCTHKLKKVHSMIIVIFTCTLSKHIQNTFSCLDTFLNSIASCCITKIYPTVRLSIGNFGYYKNTEIERGQLAVYYTSH